jgi:DNA-directed RNA polymerase specialized sigma24 family protein
MVPDSSHDDLAKIDQHFECVSLLQGLSEKAKLACLLYYFADQKVSWIAQQMGLSPKGVYAMIERGRAQVEKLETERRPPGRHRPLG